MGCTRGRRREATGTVVGFARTAARLPRLRTPGTCVGRVSAPPGGGERPDGPGVIDVVQLDHVASPVAGAVAQIGTGFLARGLPAAGGLQLPHGHQTVRRLTGRVHGQSVAHLDGLGGDRHGLGGARRGRHPVASSRSIAANSRASMLARTWTLIRPGSSRRSYGSETDMTRMREASFSASTNAVTWAGVPV